MQDVLTVVWKVESLQWSVLPHQAKAKSIYVHVYMMLYKSIMYKIH